ncbi:MAG: hypothetical protein WCK40_02250, partial [Thermoleophilia bacterium]
VNPLAALRRSLAVVAALLCVLPLTAANAAERPFSLRYSNNVNGQIIVAANTSMQCPTDTVDPLMNSGCTGARAGTNARNNNSFDMQWLDTDSDPSTFSSSSATLALNAVGHVLFAGLYWTGLQKKAEAITGANGFKAVPQNPPDAGAINKVKFKTPRASGYTSITASQVDTASIAVSSGYTAFADVTDLVSAGGFGTYTIADIQTGTGGNSFGGWSLVVAYSDPGQPLRNLSVFDGLKVVSGTSSVDIPLSGFKTPSTGQVKTTIGVVAAEGDAGMTGDYLTLNDVVLTDAVHPANNTENSTIANRGALVTSKTPNWANQLGYDSSLFQADGFLPNGATTAMFRAKTSGDTYAPQAITFATELFSPNVTLTKTSPSGQDFPGASKTYTITATNRGAGNAEGVVLRDVLPPGVTYVSGPTVTVGAGSATYNAVTNTVEGRLGTGDTANSGGILAPNESVSLTFVVTVDGDQPLGNVISNSATLSFMAADLGLPISVVANDDTTVRYPDPGIAKTLVSQVGNQYTFQLLVTNEGSIGTTGATTVTDTFGGSLTSWVINAPNGWSCNVIRTDGFSCTSVSFTTPLAPGAAYPPLLVTGTFAPGTTVTNTAVISAGSGSEPTATGTPAALNNTSTANAGQSPSATLVINKSAPDDTVSIGTPAVFQIEVRNTGPDAATGATLVDTLPAGLTYTYATISQGTNCTSTPGASGTTTVSCALGTIEPNATATVKLEAMPGMSLLGTTVENTAVARSEISSPVADFADLTVRPGADLSLTKTASAAHVAQGGAIVYTLAATNEGPGSATLMQITDDLPVGVDYLSSSADGGGACSNVGATVSCVWTSPTPSGTTRGVTINAAAKASWVGLTDADRNAVNTATTSSLTDDPNPSNNAASATVVVTDAADLQVSASGPSTLAAGGTGQISFITTNGGPSTATDAVLDVTIPTGLAPVSAPAGCTISGQSVSCALGDMASGTSTTTAIEVQVAPGLSEAPSTASATASSVTPDHIAANNTDIAPIMLGPVADLSITKTAQSATATAGGTIDYVIDVANGGPATSTGSVVTDVLPAGLTPVSLSSSIPDACAISGQTVTCQAGEIVPDEGFQVLIVAQVDSGWAGAIITNTATLTPGAQTDQNAANNTSSATITVNPGSTAADLKVTKKASAKTVKPGGTLGYTIVVTNQGGSAATSASATDTLPVGLTPTSATFNGTACTIAGRKITCTLGQMIVGASTTVKISAKVGKDRAGETLINTATASTGSQTDSNPANNTASARTTVTTSAATRARLGITTRVGPATARPGQSVLVSSTVRTLSDYPANTVRICISIPRGLTYTSSSGMRHGATVCWTRTQMRKGTPVTVSYRARAKSVGTVTALGTAVAGNAARVSARATLPIPGVTG